MAWVYHLSLVLGLGLVAAVAALQAQDRSSVPDARHRRSAPIQAAVAAKISSGGGIPEDSVLACAFTNEGAPIASASILEFDDPPALDRSAGSGFHTTGDDGCAALPGTEPRWLWLGDGPGDLYAASLVARMGLADWIPEGAIRVGPDQRTAVWNQGSACPETLQLADADGTPIAGVAVHADPEHALGRFRMLGRTDDAGRLQADTMPCWAHHIRVLPPAPFVDRELAAAALPEVVRLGRERPVQVTLARADGTPLTCEDLPHFECEGDGRYTVYVDDLHGSEVHFRLPGFQIASLELSAGAAEPVPLLLEPDPHALGIRVRERGSVHGLFVEHVVPGTAAVGLDLQAGDELVGLRLAGLPVSEELFRTLSYRVLSETRLPATFTVRRGPRTHEVELSGAIRTTPRPRASRSAPTSPPAPPAAG